MPAPKDVENETPGESPKEPEADTPSSIAAKDAALKDQLEATSNLVGSSSAVDWSHLNGAMAVQPGYRPEGPSLPDEADVNPATITEAVLTKQGWVLPLHDPRVRDQGGK